MTAKKKRKKSKRKIPKTEELPIMRSPTFMKFYVTNITGGLTDQDFRFELLNEKIELDDEWYAISDGLIILSPQGAKKLFIKLEECIKLYEAENGAIDIKETEFI
jgi:hypothetical protein